MPQLKRKPVRQVASIEAAAADDARYAVDLGHFRAQIELLGKVWPALDTSHWASPVLVPLLWAAEDTGKSIVLLASPPRFRDCYVLCRTLLETIVNALFALASGPEAVRRAKMHADQKSYRDLERSLAIGEHELRLRWSGKDELELNPDLEDALSEFTGARGQELHAWTPESMIERVKVIAEKFGEPLRGDLTFSLFMIYRHSSEILHGTLFGVLFAIHRTAPPGPPADDAEQRLRDRQAIGALLLFLGVLVSSAIRAVAEEVGLEEKALESKHLFDQYRAQIDWTTA